MATVRSAGGPSEVINARRTESLDAPAILKLVQPSTDELFGRVNMVNVIEKAVLAVTLSNDQDDILGHAAFFDYPNLKYVDPAEWETWIKAQSSARRCNSLNTLFMHYFVAKPEYSHGCAVEIIRTLFNAVPDIHYCFLVAPSGVFPDSALSHIFHQVKKDTKNDDSSVLFVCKRHEHVPVLHVRDALVQDHDDLVLIFNRQSNMLSNTYGEYFLAELIEAQDKTMRCLVAEVSGTAIGFMSVSTDVNLDLLNECFELGPFHGLRTPHNDDETEPPKPHTTCPAAEVVKRPSSAISVKSDISIASQGSLESVCSDHVSGSEGMDNSKKYLSHTSSAGQTDTVTVALESASDKMSRQASVMGDEEELRVKRKLSDVQPCPGSPNWILSDNRCAESVKSVASGREYMDMYLTTPGTPVLKIPKRFVPKYFGDTLALCIQLFCIDERFEMRSADFLGKVFDLFCDYQFLIITVPHLVPEFPLLQQFVRVPPRCPSVLCQELYVFNKAGLLKDFEVRPACELDVPGVEKLVETLELHENLLVDLHQFNKARRDDDSTELAAYVATCSDQVVGVAVVRREENIEYIRSHYNIEDFIYFNHHARSEHGHLHHYALNPVFRHHAKHFLKELLRLGHKTCLYYPLFPAYADKETLSKHSMIAAMQDMVPVRARRQIQYPVEVLGGNAPSQRVLLEQPAYALCHLNRKLTLEPKVTINARIVVVGASDVGVALLETFSFCPHLRFNNLTLISPHGLPGELPPDPQRDAMLADSQCFSHNDYACMALRAWVNCVYGKMTGIDRRKKHVVVNGRTLVPYDHLLVCTGMQYAPVAPTQADVAGGAITTDGLTRPDRRLRGPQHPANMFVVNDQYDAALALHWMENNCLNTTGRVIVYGQSLDSYCCVKTLLTLGIDGNRIDFIQPPLGYHPSCFNNAPVEAVVRASLEEKGVCIFMDFILAQFNDGEDLSNSTDTITSAGFTSTSKPMRVECAAFFNYYKRIVDDDAFKALNDACLVFDGRLVIDASFHTNDVAIRSAGSITKFQRRYHADQWSHANFNSKEVGIQLASTMLTLFDPTLEPEPEPPSDLLKLIPMYRSPKIHYAVLPGGHHYLHVTKPNLNTPLDVLMAQNDYGRELITGKVKENYFRFHMDQYNTVESITCLSMKEFPIDNLICLFSLHERYLNNMKSRFDEGLISDFYSYFQETWALAIFHDRFPDFRDEVRELLISHPSEGTEALEDKVRVLIDDDLTLSKDQRAALRDAYVEGGFKRAVETRLLSFLTYNYYHLPMYAKPGMV